MKREEFTTYDLYYTYNLKRSEEFQDFLCVELVKRGIVLSNMSSQRFQNKVGENIQGFEIKLDNRLRDTGNLYIEYKEKADPKNRKYVDSGIFRRDNSWLMVVGDHVGVYLCQKSVLVAMFNKGSYRRVETETSFGMLLPVKDADIYFKYIKFI